jgi:hypothetical protein
MNYYALFLNNNGYIENCLSLIKLISKPNSKSVAHITIRTFDGFNEKLAYIEEKKITYLDLIEPESFNLKNDKPPYVVFIRCESEEMGAIEYKPDYPYSRLHITLYEGADIEYAKELSACLETINWYFRIPFIPPLRLTKNKIGVKIESTTSDYSTLFSSVFINEDLLPLESLNTNTDKLLLIKRILLKVKEYLREHEEIIDIKSEYTDNGSGFKAKFYDQSNNEFEKSDEQPNLFSNLIPEHMVEKPVEDAIYVTPPEYAKDMAICAIEAFGDDTRKIDFGDSAVGTGALFLSLKDEIEEVNKRENKNYKISSAVGIDIDVNMAKEAYSRCKHLGLSVIYGDALSPKTVLGSQRNLMLVNPPYNRHDHIPQEYKKQIQRLVERQMDINVKGDAGLFVYHLLIMDKWLSQDGIGVWLLPSFFLQTRYGEAIRQYLTNKVQLISIHVYDDSKPQFVTINISTTIITFRKRIPRESEKIKITYGDSIIKPNFTKEVMLEEFKNDFNNWRKLFNIDKPYLLSPNKKIIKFDDLFNISRGIATGANSFFVMQRSEAKMRAIPEIALKPILPKARYLKSLIVESDDDGYPKVNPQLVVIDCELDEAEILKNYPQFYDYLQEAKISTNNEKPIIDRTLIKSRRPWYKQETREVPPFLLTYMGRNKSNLPPLYFIQNKSRAIALNTYLLLYPKKWLADLLTSDQTLYNKIIDILNDSAKKNISNQTRVYAGGLQKIEPGDLRKLLLVNLPEKVIVAYNNQYPQ